jgi:hypothetical protein
MDPAQDVHDEAHHIAYSYGKDFPLLLQPDSVQSIPLQRMSASIRGKVTLSSLASTIRASVTKTALENTILRDTAWNNGELDQVDWQSIETALHKHSRPSRIKFTKLMFDLNQTNQKNNRFYGSSTLCPSCLQAGETFQHITACSSSFMRTARSVSLTALQADLDDIFTTSIPCAKHNFGSPCHRFFP